MIAAVAIVILFFALLGAAKPSSSGTSVPLSGIFTLARESDRRGDAAGPGQPRPGHHEGSRQFWSAYPSSGAQTAPLISQTLERGGAIVAVKAAAGQSNT